MPLIQIPELPHHIYFLKDGAERFALTETLALAGHHAFGRFKFGADQVLMRNGTTVCALKSGDDDPATCLSIPVISNESVENVVQLALHEFRIVGYKPEAVVAAGTMGLITRIKIPGLGFELAIHPNGRQMSKRMGGLPKFQPYA